MIKLMKLNNSIKILNAEKIQKFYRRHKTKLILKNKIQAKIKLQVYKFGIYFKAFKFILLF